MSEIVRLYRYRALLSTQRAVSAAELMAVQEVSAATFKRDIAKLRDQLGLPIVFDRELRGYRLEGMASREELPGLWLGPDEVLALLSMQQMLTDLEPGLLGPKLKPLQSRLLALLGKHGLDAAQLAQRIRVVHAGKRSAPLANFEALASATLARRQLSITHQNRHNAELLTRIVSPQQLVHYRDNWYLDAWCHLRGAIRTFALDAIQSCQILDMPSKEVDGEAMRQELQKSYGIYSGHPVVWATLKFSKDAARLVEQEQWHPDQKSHFEPDGSYVLQVPYSNERELIEDVLRHGADVEVLVPASLREFLYRVLHGALKLYGSSPLTDASNSEAQVRF